MKNCRFPNKENSSISALVVEGGAMRSVFSAGLLDGFLRRGFNPFDMYIGVSAGANNLAAYLAGVPGKSLNIYTDLALRKEFISYARFLRGGHFIDLDWLSEKTFSHKHIDLRAVYKTNKPFYVVVTDVNTGKAEYIKTSIDTLGHTIKASASLPLLYRGFPQLNGQPMTDGGVADGIPLRMVIEHGATHIMLVRSRHKSYMKKDSMFHRYIRWKLKNFSRLTDAMKRRVEIFKETMDVIRNPPAGINVIEICPPDDFTIGRFCRNSIQLNQGYILGYEHADEAIKLWVDAIAEQAA